MPFVVLTNRGVPRLLPRQQSPQHTALDLAPRPGAEMALYDFTDGFDRWTLITSVDALGSSTLKAVAARGDWRCWLQLPEQMLLRLAYGRTHAESPLEVEQATMRAISVLLFGATLAAAMSLPFIPYLNTPERLLPAMLVLSVCNLAGAYYFMRSHAEN